MKRVIEIIQNREGISFNEAALWVEEVRNAIMDMIRQGEQIWRIEDYFMHELGLEPDYIFEVIDC